MKVHGTLGCLSALLIACGAAIACTGSTLDPTSGSGGGRAAAAAPPNVTRLTPASGPVGSAVTIQGSGFAAENNTVKFGQGYVKGLSSSDGTSIRFTVPDGLDLCPPDSTTPCPGAYPRVQPGDYAVAVITQGATSSTLTFTVTQ